MIHSLGGRKYNPWAAEILHKDFHSKFDINMVFLNPKLFLVRLHVISIFYFIAIYLF
jgi:hypothetical protein